MPDVESFDCVVIGTGPGGRAVAPALAAEGYRVAAVEAELVGGECPFWACIPSKTLLRGVQWRADGDHIAGAGAAQLRWDAVRAYRDYMTSGLDDSRKALALETAGVSLLRGHAHIVEPGLVEVGDRRLACAEIVVATGSVAAIPELAGLDRARSWTNRELTALREVPSSAVILGAGPVGIEGAQFLAGHGCRVTLVESAARPLAREEPEVGELVARALREAGVDLRTGVSVRRVEHGAVDVRVELDDGAGVTAGQLVLATGRRPRVEGMVVDGVGLERGAIEIDERCRAAAGIWAIGDVTGVAPFTHVAGYQGRVVVDAILGRPGRADYRAVPRVVFCDPEVAAVGATVAQARAAGHDAVPVVLDLHATDRTETYGTGLFGGAAITVDRDRGTIVGAWAVGPQAGEWIHVAALAVKAQVPLAVLADFAPQFPTFSELWGSLARQARAQEVGPIA